MTNFEIMMEKMMEQYMERYMETMMTKMFSNMLGATEVANAEVEKPKKTVNTLSKEDFLAIEEVVDEVAAPVELDFVVYGTKTAKYNKSVESNIWIINHLAITKNYGARWSKKNGGYIFDTTSDLRNFLASYKIITELTDDDRKAIDEYKKERALRRAEYYAKLAK